MISNRASAACFRSASGTSTRISGRNLALGRVKLNDGLVAPFRSVQWHSLLCGHRRRWELQAVDALLLQLDDVAENTNGGRTAVAPAAPAIDPSAAVAQLDEDDGRVQPSASTRMPRVTPCACTMCVTQSRVIGASAKQASGRRAEAVISANRDCCSRSARGDSSSSFTAMSPCSPSHLQDRLGDIQD